VLTTPVVPVRAAPPQPASNAATARATPARYFMAHTPRSRIDPERTPRGGFSARRPHPVRFARKRRRLEGAGALGLAEPRQHPLRLGTRPLTLRNAEASAPLARSARVRPLQQRGPRRRRLPLARGKQAPLALLLANSKGYRSVPVNTCFESSESAFGTSRTERRTKSAPLALHQIGARLADYFELQEESTSCWSRLRSRRELEPPGSGGRVVAQRRELQVSHVDAQDVHRALE
jgi:hypothetical protein